ncbi:MAG: GMC family oxidoreductase N-terminal domain-containing protein [Burkholderiaceae bacterium]|jgi:cholesterol oxidase|nr:GMC family oxidoreductase N-terminal domain-containing protein [Burkholderiaceae bacterium]
MSPARSTKTLRRLSHSAEHLEAHYEIVVIGSGYGGAIAASRLARAGRQVCLLERGRERQPGEYPQSEFEGLGEFQQNTPIGHLGSRLGLFELHLNDDISALVGCGLGGTSLINAGVCLRPDARVLSDARWPAAFRNDLKTRLAEGYLRATEMLRPTPLPADFPHPPKLAALEKSAHGLHWGERFSRPPINVTFADGPNHVGVEQTRCNGCGDCVSGCNYGAKNTTLMNYLPDAVAHGAKIFTGANVRSIAKRSGNPPWIVHYQLIGVGRESFDAPELFITADIVIIAAGALGSTQILLRSKARALALSERIGEHFTGNGDVLAFGYNTGTPINGIGWGTKKAGAIAPVGPCITGLIDNRATADVNQGFVIEEGSIPGAIGALMPTLLNGAALVSSKAEPAGLGQRIQEMERVAESALLGPHRGAVAHTQTYLAMAHDGSAGKLSLADDRLRITWPEAGSQPIFKTVNDALDQATVALEGGAYVPNPIWSRHFGRKLITVHPLGGCAMAERAEEGAVDHAGRVYAGATGTAVHDGLWVADGSVMPRSLGVNPLLTIAAIAERTCALLADARGWTIDYSLSTPPPVMTGMRPGLTFTETMRGTFDTGSGGDPAPMCFTLTITSDDLQALLTDPSHTARMTGTVVCTALSAEPMSVENGEFHLFVEDPTHAGHRLMTYQMVLHAEEGRQFWFSGTKTITAAPAYDAWSQLTTLAVKVNAGADAQGALLGQGVLKIELLDFLKQLRTIDVPNAPDAATRLKGIARFGEFFAGAMWDAYGGVFAKVQRFDPDAPARIKRALRVGPAQVYPVRTSDGVDLRLTRYRGGTKGPVLLLHGAGVSSQIFSTDLIDTNLLEYLYAHGYDCWLGDFRASIDLACSAESSDADQVARYDHPALIGRVLEITAAANLQVFAHCYGATTFTMALLAGVAGVRSAVLSQISAHIKTLPMTRLKVGLHLPDILAALGVKDLTAYSDTHERWMDRLFDDALRLYPITHDELCRSAVCHRISFLYGLLYNHKNLSSAVHERLHELFGVCNVKTFDHLAQMVRAGHVVSTDGAYDYLAHLDRMKLPIAFIHGSDNQCFLPESTAITFDQLCKRNGAGLYSRHVVDGYGHIDCIFGQNAASDVYPLILAHLEKTAQ